MALGTDAPQIGARRSRCRWASSPSIVRRSRIQVPRSYRFYGIVTDRDLFEEKTTLKHIFVSGRLIRVP
jgi:hypothetical protein